MSGGLFGLMRGGVVPSPFLEVCAGAAQMPAATAAAHDAVAREDGLVRGEAADAAEERVVFRLAEDCFWIGERADLRSMELDRVCVQAQVHGVERCDQRSLLRRERRLFYAQKPKKESRGRKRAGRIARVGPQLSRGRSKRARWNTKLARHRAVCVCVCVCVCLF